ncbi:myosin light chain kinase family member 4 isoform X2 [Hemicordylus capensis]|uniref:myosin light chain kinase family member 4 isoform X2 n=1 Tax=Hemicordylus capensis TaxID=884348 RepID=UPI0023033CF2|nr:myosin light chain kinase family member 4 isoform X2 [Hemicordylus capensis]
MGGKQKKLVPISDNLKHPIQQKGEIRGHSYSLIYGTKLEKCQYSNVRGISTKFYKLNRLDEINTRNFDSRQDRMAFFHGLETVESFTRDEEEKSYLTAKGTKSIKKKKPPDSSEESEEKTESYSHTEKVHKLNKENTEASTFFVQKSLLKSHTRGSKDNAEESHSNSWKSPLQKTTGKSQVEVNAMDEANKKTSGQDTKSDSLGLVKKCDVSEESQEEVRKETEQKDANKDEEQEVRASTSQSEERAEDVEGSPKSQGQDAKNKESEKAPFSVKDGQTSSSKRRVNDGGLTQEDNKKSRVAAANTGNEQKPEDADKPRTAEPTMSEKLERSDSATNKSENNQEAASGDIFTIDDSPPPSAPFDHRIVSAKRAGINSFYHVHKGEVLGGGRFGQVHKCEEKSTGLKLAAKIIKARGVKEKDEVKNEINVMNQLNHVNLIQLYDAFESKNDIVLVMEYVEGGELFDRIIDENCFLTEIDTILFIKQICEGIQYMHQMYILHLDLKPENILCVNREANKIKIIDFGLARRYKPREKLKVNFGTPEFLAPEVVNYDFVSFPTDMWSIGVIAYMLLSGLSPFLGDDDNETLNNILACRWDFEDEEFENVSEEAKDFITKLLIKEKGWRISATAAIKHPWLSDQTLHCKLQAQKNCCVITAAMRFGNKNQQFWCFDPPPPMMTGGFY